MTLDLILKLLTLAPALEKDGAAMINELKSNDDNKTKVLALIGELEALLAQIKTLLS